MRLRLSVRRLLSGALLQEDVVDEIVCYVAPVLMGSEARPLALLPIERMEQRRHWQFHEVTRLGEDLRIVLRPAVQRVDLEADARRVAEPDDAVGDVAHQLPFHGVRERVADRSRVGG